MPKRRVPRFELAAVLLVATLTGSKAETLVTCPKTPGFVAGPFVPTEEAAREIYKIMVATIAPRSVEEYPLVVVKDEGDHWWATQAAMQPSGGRGGGQLYMQIDKCTGAISRAAFNR